MRYDKLAGIVKRIGLERLSESNHAARYRGSKRISGRYKPSVKLAQEAAKDNVAKNGNPELNLEPKIDSFDKY
jgi:hypothetical protein